MENSLSNESVSCGSCPASFVITVSLSVLEASEDDDDEVSIKQSSPSVVEFTCRKQSSFKISSDPSLLFVEIMKTEVVVLFGTAVEEVGAEVARLVFTVVIVDSAVGDDEQVKEEDEVVVMVVTVPLVPF